MLCYWGAQVREGFGLPDKGDRVQHANDVIRCVCPKSDIQDMSAGKCFVGFIRNGKVSVLRLRDEPNSHDGKLKGLHLKDNFRSIVCGGSDAVLLTHKGKVFTKIESPPVYKPLRGLDNRHVIQISCGEKHSMALTQDGRVFVWGENSHGQLGLGEGRSGSQTPQHAQCLDGVPLAQISAGGDHSFVLSLSGVVFGWGRNSSGQLGLGDTTDRHVPTAVKSLNGKKTQFISCGGEHTATLSKGGTVFTFGSGGFGQLGHNSFKDEHLPRVVAELWGSTVTQITCGRHHTLVLVASSKQIYSFGCGMQGQLGNGQMIDQSVPSPVHLPADFNDEYAIGKVISGENHSFALLYKVHGNASINLESNKSRGIVTLDDKMINQWVSECNSKWNKTQNKINQVFSSAASLNGSFLKTSCDEHYQTSAEVCGLDFALVKKSFAKLSANERVMSKVVETIRSTLLPASPATVEALRVYLLIPELIRVCQRQHRAELLEALACNTLQLHPEALKVLENYWSKLPANCLKGLVKFFRKETSKSIGRIAVDEINWNTPERLQRFAQILQMVYKVCCSVHNNITKSDFIINEINDLLDTLQSITEDLNNNWWLHHWNGKIQTLKDLANYYDQTLKKLKSFPCIFNLEAKCRFLKNRLRPDCYKLVLRRTALLEDCFSLLKKATDQQLKGWLAVSYAEDVAYRSDVNKRDFFLNVIKELREPDSQFFMYNDNKTMIWFPTQPTVEKEKYLLLGILCGLAFSNNCVVHLPFPLALFKKLFNVKPTLQDLKEFKPGFGQSLEHVLEYSDDDVFKKMEMEFTVPWDGRDVELDPSNPGKMVTNSNKTDFVDKCVDYTLNKSVEEIFEEFRRGFFKGCDRDLVEMFVPEELRGALVGNEDYDWDILKQNTTYEELFHAGHSTIISFWQVFDELTSNQKKTFLLFLTGFERVPILGMSQVKMRVRNLFNSTEDHLPQALTCHALLELPVYQSKATLKDKLIEALNHRRGFWEE